MNKKVIFSFFLLGLLLVNGCGEEHSSKVNAELLQEPTESADIQNSKDFVVNQKTLEEEIPKDIVMESKEEEFLTKDEKLLAKNQELEEEEILDMQSNEENFAQEADEIDFDEEV
jgi:hypothetical protein